MRPYVLASCAVSADGYLDDASPDRLILSGAADLDRVDEVRAGVDAILVGAGTIRRDNPRLRVRDPGRRAARGARGLPEQPLRVALTAKGDLDRAAEFFAHPSPHLVYRDLPLDAVLDDLGARNITRLMVEGGATVLGAFLAQDLVNELHLAVAPFFVADSRSPRLNVPVAPKDRMTLVDVRRLDDVVVSRYLLGPGGADQRFLRWAIELSRLCPPSDTAFSVGAVVVSETGEVLSTGFSREQEDKDHAEEVALRKLAHPGQQSSDPRLKHATIYSSLVPCGARASRPVTCVQHILNTGIPRVVYAWREPPLFAVGDGAEQLAAAGVAVTEIGSVADLARSVNAHLSALQGQRYTLPLQVTENDFPLTGDTIISGSDPVISTGFRSPSAFPSTVSLVKSARVCVGTQDSVPGASTTVSADERSAADCVCVVDASQPRVVSCSVSVNFDDPS